MLSEAEDVILRASISNDTAAGAAAVKQTHKKLGDDIEASTRARLKNEAESYAELRRFEETQAKAVAAEKKAQIQTELESLAALREFEQQYASGKRGGSKSNGDGSSGGKGGGGEGRNPFARALRDQKTTGLGANSRGIVDSLDEMFPKLKIAAGAGIVGIAGGMLNDLATKTAIAADHLRDGQHNAADMTLEIGKAIPILGNFVSAGEQINEIFTGQKAELEAINTTVEMTVQLTDRWAAITRKVKQEEADQARALAKDDREIAAIGMRGIEAERQAIANKYTDQRAANQKAREDAKNAALDNPDVKAAQAAKAEFEKKYGGKTLTGDLATQKENLDKRARDIAAKANQERDDKLKFLDTEDAKKAEEEKKELGEKNKLYREGLQIQQQSHEAQIARTRSQTEAQGLATGGFGVEARQKQIEADAEASRSQAIVDAKQRSNATTNADELETIDRQLADNLVEIEKKKNADIAAAQKEAGLAAKRFAFDAGQAEADAVEVTAENRLRLQGRGFEAEQAARQRAHDRRNAEIDQKAEEEIARDKDHAADIRRRATAEKQTNDAQLAQQRYEQYVGLYHQGAAGNPLGEFRSAGRTTGRAELFRQSFNPASQMLELARKQLTATQDVATAVREGNGSGGGGSIPTLPKSRGV